MVDVHLDQVEDGVLAVVGQYPSHDTEVRALLVHGRARSVLIDTLARPQDLEVVRAEMARRDRPLWVVNSHADWDHWWGNAAFPEAPVFASAAALRRQQREGTRELRRMAAKEPDLFGGMALRPADVAFGEMISLDLGGVSVELHPLSGHTHDQVVAWLPERKLLFAADAAEDPFPLVTEGPIAGWAERLEGWAERAQRVVPAHGPVSGPALLRRNATYLRSLLDESSAAAPEVNGVDAFYRRAHRRNLKRGAAEAHEDQSR